MISDYVPLQFKFLYWFQSQQDTVHILFCSLFPTHFLPAHSYPLPSSAPLFSEKRQVWSPHWKSSSHHFSEAPARHFRVSTPLPRSQVLCKNFKVKVLVAQLCLTLCDPMDCSLPGSSVLGILQARILEWIAIPFSRGSSQPRGRTGVSCIAGRFFTIWATRGAHKNVNYVLFRKVVFVFLLLEALNSMKFRDHFLSIPSVCGIIIAHEWLN